MTLPALIHSYRKQQVENKLKSTYVILTQLFERSQLDNGKIDSWPILNWESGEQTKFYNKYIIPYLNGAKQCKINDTKRICQTDIYSADGSQLLESKYNTHYKIILPNNVSLQILPPSHVFASDSGGVRMEIRIDLNISSDKIRRGIDYFQFVALKANINDFTYIGAVKPYTNNKQQLYLPKCDVIENSDFVMSDGTRINAKNLCLNNIDDRYGYGDIYCAALIQCNGWKIPDNYPIKL